MKNCVKMHVMEELDRSVGGKMQIKLMLATLRTVHAHQMLMLVMMEYVILWKGKMKASVHKIVFIKVVESFCIFDVE